MERFHIIINKRDIKRSFMYDFNYFPDDKEVNTVWERLTHKEIIPEIVKRAVKKYLDNKEAEH